MFRREVLDDLELIVNLFDLLLREPSFKIAECFHFAFTLGLDRHTLFIDVQLAKSWRLRSLTRKRLPPDSQLNLGYAALLDAVRAAETVTQGVGSFLGGKLGEL